MRLVLGIAGIVLLLIGFITPIAKYEYDYADEDVTILFSGLGGDSTNGYRHLKIVLLVTLVAMMLGKGDTVWFFGLVTLGVLINDFRLVMDAVSDDENLKLSWGWLILFSGSLMMVATIFFGGVQGFTSRFTSSRSQQPQRSQPYDPWGY